MIVGAAIGAVVACYVGISFFGPGITMNSLAAIAPRIDWMREKVRSVERGPINVRSFFRYSFLLKILIGLFSQKRDGLSVLDLRQSYELSL